MIETILVVMIAALPVALLFGFIYESDRYKQEPLKWLLAAFLLGTVAAGVTFLAGFPTFGSGLYDNHPFDFGDCLRDGFLLQAIPSEVAKFIMLWLLLHVNKYYDEHIDSIVYSTCIALGFIGINNGYFLFHINEWFSYGIVNALVLVPFHFAYGAVMGYFYGYMNFFKKCKWAAWILALIVTIVLDGFASATLMSIDLTVNEMPLFVVYVIIVYLVLFWLTKWGVHHLLEEDRIWLESENENVH